MFKVSSKILYVVLSIKNYVYGRKNLVDGWYL